MDASEKFPWQPDRRAQRLPRQARPPVERRAGIDRRRQPRRHEAPRPLWPA